MIGSTTDRRGHPASPHTLAALEAESEALGFLLASEPAVGSLLRCLAASKPGGTLLELGTGTGVGTAWLLDGMDAAARLVSVDHDARAGAPARRHLGGDPRVTFVTDDAAAVLARLPAAGFDLLFADAWPGKYTHLDDALARLRPGGLYVVDDMLARPDWSAEHRALAAGLEAKLRRRPDLAVTSIEWSTGLILAAKRG